MRYFLLLYGVSLGLTLLIEIPVCLCFGLRRKEQLLLVLLTNLLTNPAAVWLHTSLGLQVLELSLLLAFPREQVQGSPEVLVYSCLWVMFARF